MIPTPATNKQQTIESNTMKTLAPMLAKNWNPDDDPTGWLMSEKLDGVRAVWNGADFLSRNGKVFDAPDWFKQNLPPLPLDGELFTARGRFNEAVAIVRAHGADWSPLCYAVFDIQGEGDFKTRWQEILQWTRPRHLALVETQPCQGQAHLEKYELSILAQGGEGVMLRAPGAPYEARRSPHLRKLKRFRDDEATILAHIPGEGKHTGRMGALACELTNGTRVSVGAGFTDAMRANPPPLGAKISLRYFELTPAGVPRFPTFLSIRNYE